MSTNARELRESFAKWKRTSAEHFKRTVAQHVTKYDSYCDKGIEGPVVTQAKIDKLAEAFADLFEEQPIKKSPQKT